jgi:hypothetical protein
MTIKFPTHLNLEFLVNSKQFMHEDDAPLCHIEHDDEGDRTRAIPLKVNQNGHISLDFKNSIKLN